MEKRLDALEDLRYDTLELRIVRGKLQRGIHQQASLVLRIRHRTLHDLAKERLERDPRSKGRIAPQALAQAALDVMLEHPVIQTAFIAEGVVQACAGNPHAFGQIARRSRPIATRPEPGKSGLQCRLLIEFAWSCHALVPRLDINPPVRRANQGHGRTIILYHLI
jgi:hypothetical protein